MKAIRLVPNINNMEIVQGITKQPKVNAPLILQVSAGGQKICNPHT